MGWLLINPPSISKMTPLSISLLLIMKLQARPVHLSRTIIFHCANVDQIFLDRVGGHSTGQLRQDIEADVCRPAIRKNLQELISSQQHAKKCQIAQGSFGLLNESRDPPACVNLNDSAA